MTPGRKDFVRTLLLSLLFLLSFAATAMAQEAHKLTGRQKYSGAVHLPLNFVSFGPLYSAGSDQNTINDGNGNLTSVNSSSRVLGIHTSTTNCFLTDKTLSEQRLIISEVENVEIGVGFEMGKKVVIPIFGGFIGGIAAFRVNNDIDVAAQVAYKLWAVTAWGGNHKKMFGPSINLKGRYKNIAGEGEVMLNNKDAGDGVTSVKYGYLQLKAYYLPGSDNDLSYGVRLDMLLQKDLTVNGNSYQSNGTNIFLFMSLGF